MAVYGVRAPLDTAEPRCFSQHSCPISGTGVSETGPASPPSGLRTASRRGLRAPPVELWGVSRRGTSPRESGPATAGPAGRGADPGDNGSAAPDHSDRGTTAPGTTPPETAAQAGPDAPAGATAESRPGSPPRGAGGPRHNARHHPRPRPRPRPARLPPDPAVGGLRRRQRLPGHPTLRYGRMFDTAQPTVEVLDRPEAPLHWDEAAHAYLRTEEGRTLSVHADHARCPARPGARPPSRPTPPRRPNRPRSFPSPRRPHRSNAVTCRRRVTELPATPKGPQAAPHRSPTSITVLSPGRPRPLSAGCPSSLCRSLPVSSARVGSLPLLAPRANLPPLSPGDGNRPHRRPLFQRLSRWGGCRTSTTGGTALHGCGHPGLAGPFSLLELEGDKPSSVWTVRPALCTSERGLCAASHDRFRPPADDGALPGGTAKALN